MPLYLEKELCKVSGSENLNICDIMRRQIHMFEVQKERWTFLKNPTQID
jgi:hypothetical protein